MNGFNLSNIQNAILGSTQVSALYYGSKLIWENYHDYSIEYFTIEPTTSDGADVYVTKGTQDQIVNLSYSTDLINWTSVTIDTYGSNYTLVDHVFYGEKMYIKGINNALGTSTAAGFKIYAIEPYKVYGNIMSLLYGDNFTNQTTLTDSYSFSYLFSNSNNGLTDTSNLILPATTLTNYCYYNMFSGCKSLTTTPALPATTLVNYCYYNMFLGCTSLITPPALPATTLANYCYYNMFNNCTQLSKAPALPATTLTDYCYYSMFRACTSLTTAPALPATTLAGYCYYNMFIGCSSLTSAPALPATTLAVYCYYAMFRNCTSLTSAPELPATTLTGYCYYSMFAGCTSLMYIKTLATDISAINSHYLFTSGVNTTGGTFIKNYNTQWPTGNSGIPSGWNVSNIYNVNIDNSIVGGTITSNIAYALPNDTVILTVTPDPHCTVQSLTVVDENDNPVTVTNNQFTMPNSNVTVSAVFNINYNEMYLTIESLEDSNDIGWKSNNSTTKTIQWSTDMTNWTSVTSSTTGELLATLNTGDKLYIKGNNSAYGATWSTWNIFTSTKTYNVYGNILSMSYGDDFINKDAPSGSTTYWRMFINTGVVDASNLILPRTVRSTMYTSMFQGCTSLTAAPAIPNATGYQSYNTMFEGCTSLTTAPVLRANPGQYSYRQMFQNCTSLNSVTVYATSLGSSGFDNWLQNTAATGTFTKLSTMTLFPEGASGIPSGWTVVDV